MKTQCSISVMALLAVAAFTIAFTANAQRPRLGKVTSLQVRSTSPVRTQRRRRLPDPRHSLASTPCPKRQIRNLRRRVTSSGRGSIQTWK